MAEADSTRKRSRSPSESEQKQNKRPNTGASPSAGIPNFLCATVELTNQIIFTGASNEPDTERATSPAGSATDAKDGTTSPTASPSATIHMRCLIVTQDASIIIGKAGSHVNEIREKSGARVMVSESIPGNPERILNVSGPLDAVSKVCFLSLSALVILTFFPAGFWSHCPPNQR